MIRSLALIAAEAFLEALEIVELAMV